MEESVTVGAYYKFLQWLKRENYLFKWRYILPFTLLTWLFFLMGGNLQGTIFITLMGIAASYSTYYKRAVKIPSAIELVTIGTVVTSIHYGPVAGALFGIITTLGSEVVSGAVDVFTILYMFARGVIGAVAFLFADWNIVLLGIGAVLLFNIICQPFYLMPGDIETKIKGMYYFVTNIVFNFLAFFFLGNILLAIAG